MPKNEHSWTVHGIWPASLNGEKHQYCDKSWIFNPEVIKPIEKHLNISWINIKNGTVLSSFWAHEWFKHGTCAAVLEPFNSELKYFQMGLEWLNKYSMNSILEEYDIVPSDDKEYNITDINNAVKSKLGVNPRIECRTKSHQQYLIEIRVCVTRNLELTNCNANALGGPKDSVSVGNCLITKGIRYPRSEYTSKRVHQRIIQPYHLSNLLRRLVL